METLAEKASRMISDMKEKIKSINPDFQFPNFDNREDFESLTKTAHRMVSDMRKKIKADHPGYLSLITISFCKFCRAIIMGRFCIFSLNVSV